MRLFLAPNGYTDRQVEQAERCFHRLTACGHTCAVPRVDSLRFFDGGGGNSFGPGECDLIVSLGGDGSVLRAAQLALQYDKPLLGINSGRLGWLCAMGFDETDEFDSIFADCMLSQRSVLAFEYEGYTFFAVNDVVVGKLSFGGAVDLGVAVGKERPSYLRGDGLIAATPTGSTAYNLSAGGPVLDAKLNAIALTPICPHGCFDRPVVVDDSRVVLVSVRNDSAGLYADGRYIGGLDGALTIRKAAKTLALYVRKERDPLNMTEMERHV